MIIRYTMLCLITAACFLQSCGLYNTTTILIPVINPSEVNTKGYTSVYIEEFTDYDRHHRDGELIRSTVIEELATSNSVRIVLQAPQNRGFDDKTMIISGSVLHYNYNEHLNSVEKCLPRKIWYKDSSGKRQEKTVNDSIVIDYTRSGVLDVSVQFRITDAVSGELLGIRTMTDGITLRTEQRNGTPEPIRIAPADAEVRRRIAGALVRLIFPYKSYDYVKVFWAMDMPELRRGNNFAASGEWDYAIKEYRQALSNYPTNESLHIVWYNLGIAYQYSYNFAKAEEHFREALRLDPDNLLYSSAITLCRDMEARQRELAKTRK